MFETSQWWNKEHINILVLVKILSNQTNKNQEIEWKMLTESLSTQVKEMNNYPFQLLSKEIVQLSKS